MTMSIRWNLLTVNMSGEIGSRLSHVQTATDNLAEDNTIMAHFYLIGVDQHAVDQLKRYDKQSDWIRNHQQNNLFVWLLVTRCNIAIIVRNFLHGFVHYCYARGIYCTFIVFSANRNDIFILCCLSYMNFCSVMQCLVLKHRKTKKVYCTHNHIQTDMILK